MDQEADRLWRAILDTVREESHHLADYLHDHATMRLEHETREVMVAGPHAVYEFLQGNPVLAELLNRACEQHGWSRYVYERLDIPSGISPSAYAFIVELGELEDDEEEEIVSIRPVSPFDDIRTVLEDGSERWYARDLEPLLGYKSHHGFHEAIQRAKEACAASGHIVPHHFAEVERTVHGKRRQADVALTRFACYLVAMNGDARKPEIAGAQTYFAVQTRRQELAQELRGLMRRAKLHDETDHHGHRLVRAARDAGVLTDRDHEVFQNYGYMGLYDGLGIADLRRRKRLGATESPLDYMGFDELAANALRISLTEQKLKRDHVHTADAANQVHYAMGQLVRETLEEAGATMPEDLPTPDHIDHARDARLGEARPDP